MTTGLTGSYAVNAVDICPENGQWIPKPALGIDGNGHSVYPAMKDFEMSWGFISMSDFNTLYNAYLLVSNTGTITVDLPDITASDFRFRRFSGAILHEPQTSQYFEGYMTDVRLLITNIRV